MPAFSEASDWMTDSNKFIFGWLIKSILKPSSESQCNLHACMYVLYLFCYEQTHWHVVTVDVFMLRLKTETQMIKIMFCCATASNSTYEAYWELCFIMRIPGEDVIMYEWMNEYSGAFWIETVIELWI